jgi:hypothetical protein
MCCDPEKGKIYVFGGRILSARSMVGDSQYSGLYVYVIATGTWTCLR